MFYYKWGNGNISFDQADDVSVHFKTFITPFITDTYNFTLVSDAGNKWSFDGFIVNDNMTPVGNQTYYYNNVLLNAFQTYTILIDFADWAENAEIQLYWKTSTVSNRTIPAENLSIPYDVSSSPYQITVNWPTGYHNNDPTNPTLCKEVWGDGVKTESEICDDGNIASGDGCSSDWSTIESGFICSGSTWQTWNNGKSPDAPKTSWIIQWGDGLRAGSEVWDDGNTSSGDGWSSDCSTIENGYVWTGGGLTSKDICTFWTAGFYPNALKSQWVTTCGDSLRAGSETWDDGNISSSDGWNSSCSTIESGYIWVGGSTTSKDTWTKCQIGYYPNSSKSLWVTTWGDALRAGSEIWDDGNILSSDGWNSSCSTIESGYIWVGGSTTSKDTWTKCQSGYYPNSSKSQWVTTWGDGLRAGSEKWDDGNTNSGDGCKNDWSIESGYVCSGGTPTSKDTCTKWDKGFYQNDASNPTTCVTKWGDGIRAGGEICDDGNAISGDGWPSDCSKVEDGWSWYGGWFGVTDVWVQCDLGYDPNPDYSSWIGAEAPRDVKALSAAAALSAYLGVSSNLVLTVFSSSTSSSSNSFGMINQIQLVIIFPLIGPYLPQKIYDYLKSMSTSLFNLNFLPTSNTESIISFKDVFDFKQQNSYLYLLELKSGSAFVNILDLTTTVGFVIWIHIILLIIFTILHKLGRFNVVKKIISKILAMLTFGFYIGVWLETYLLFWLVEFSEIHYQNKNGVKNLKSTVMSYVILFFMLLFISLAFWQWLKSRTTEGLERLKYFKLLVEDMKPKWIWRAYWLLFLLRRTVFLAIIFFMGELEMIVKVILFVIIQMFYLGYIAILRPQGAFKDNIIDFVNEVFYFYFVGFLLYYNSEERWSDTVTDVYFWIMMSNNFILMFVIFSKQLITIFSVFDQINFQDSQRFMKKN